MIFITGDTHGDFTRFRSDIFPEQAALTKEDFVIICGDFGGVWSGKKEEAKKLDWLEARPFTTLFVDGNHENFDLLATYPVEQWRGGKVQFLRPSVIRLMRGQVFDLCGKRVFTMGGASSHDIQDGILETNAPGFEERYRELWRSGALFRVNHHSWWAEELPSAQEYVEGERNLDAYGRQVDFIISHCGPSSVLDIIGGGMYQHDKLTDCFDTLKDSCRFQYWFFGHYHENRAIAHKYILLYEQMIQVEPPE